MAKSNALLPTKLSPVRFIGYWGLNAVMGAIIGACSGAISGTLLFPIFGTFYGAFAGAAGGALGGLILGPFTALSIQASAGTREALKLVQLVGGAGSCLALIFIAMVYGGIDSLPFAFLLCLPVSMGAALAGRFTLESALESDVVTAIDAGDYGRTIGVAHVAVASALGSGLFWLGALALGS